MPVARLLTFASVMLAAVTVAQDPIADAAAAAAEAAAKAAADAAAKVAAAAEKAAADAAAAIAAKAAAEEAAYKEKEEEAAKLLAEAPVVPEETEVPEEEEVPIKVVPLTPEPDTEWGGEEKIKNQTELEIQEYMSNVQKMMTSAKRSRDYVQASLEIDVKVKALEKAFNLSKAKNVELQAKIDLFRKGHEASISELQELKAEKKTIKLQNEEVSKKLKEKKLEKSMIDEANTIAFKLEAQRKQLEEKKTASKGLEKLLYIEVALKEKSDQEVKSLEAKIVQIKKDIKEGITLNKQFKDASQRAQDSMNELQTKENRLNLMIDDHKSALQRLEDEKKQQEKECNDEAKVQLAGVQTTIQLTEEQKQNALKIKKNLKTKVDLWKSMTNFLQKDLESTKSATTQMKLLFAAEKAKQSKIVKAEQLKTESELQGLKDQIKTIATRANNNKKAADDMVAEQEIATKQAMREVTRLRKQLMSLQKLHKLAKSQMTLAQKQTYEAQQNAVASAKGKMMTLVEGLKIQRAKANQAMGKVQVLQSALKKLEKASTQIELQPVQVTNSMTRSDSKIVVAPLPSFSLTGSRTPSQQTQKQYLDSLALKESAELQRIASQFELAKANVVAGFKSDSTVQAMAQTASVKIEADRQRIIRFQSTVKQRYSKYKTAFENGRLSQAQMDKVKTWANNRMDYARQRYAEFRKETAVLLDQSVQSNQDIKLKLNGLLMSMQAEKTAVRQKYAALRSVNP